MTSSSRYNFVQCLSPQGLHRMAYQEWGDRDNPDILICVHGVTRISSDFDVLASHLQDRFRVICPDVVGRGKSDWLPKAELYQIPQYLSDMVTLIAKLSHLEKPVIHWLGTSMGGLIGMTLASLAHSPIHKLVINDVGPSLNYEGLMRIAEYLGQALDFQTLEEAQSYIKAISLSFGEHSEAQWQKIANDVLVQKNDGKWTRHYDLKIAESIKSITPETAAALEQSLWAAFDAIRAPTLLLRGEHSDLLTRDTVHHMQARGPQPQCIELKNCGHAPTLVHPEQIQIVRDFLVN